MFPCRERAKEPLIKNWPDAATSEVDQIAKWLIRWPACNWAVTTGSRSGIWVLDVDGQQGLYSFWNLCKQHGGFFDTLGVKTSGESSHLYFRWPSDADVIRNSAKKIGAGIDVRGEGGYVIVPPSHHPNGVAYEWFRDCECQAIIDAPRWLLEFAMGSKEAHAATA